MTLRRLNKIVQTDDPEQIQQYKLLGFTESSEEPEPTGRGREPEPKKLEETPKESKRGRKTKADENHMDADENKLDEDL